MKSGEWPTNFFIIIFLIIVQPFSSLSSSFRIAFLSLSRICLRGTFSNPLPENLRSRRVGSMEISRLIIFCANRYAACDFKFA